MQLLIEGTSIPAGTLRFLARFDPCALVGVSAIVLPSFRPLETLLLPPSSPLAWLSLFVSRPCCEGLL